MQVYSSHIFYVRTKPAASYITLKKYGPPGFFNASFESSWPYTWRQRGADDLGSPEKRSWKRPVTAVDFYRRGLLWFISTCFFQSLAFTHFRLLRFAVFARRMHSNVPIWGISPAMSNVCVMCVCACSGPEENNNDWSQWSQKWQCIPFVWNYTVVITLWLWLTVCHGKSTHS